MVDRHGVQKIHELDVTRQRLRSLFGKAVQAAHKELNSSRLPILYLF